MSKPRNYDWAGPRFLRGLTHQVQTGVRATCDGDTAVLLSHLHGDQPTSSSTTSSAVTTIYRGLDVHKESDTIAVLPEGATAPTRVERLPNDFVKLRRFVDRVQKDGEIRACDNASGRRITEADRRRSRSRPTLHRKS